MAVLIEVQGINTNNVADIKLSTSNVSINARDFEIDYDKVDVVPLLHLAHLFFVHAILKREIYVYLSFKFR